MSGDCDVGKLVRSSGPSARECDIRFWEVGGREGRDRLMEIGEARFLEPEWISVEVV